jgi:hypothetical protein
VGNGVVVQGKLFTLAHVADSARTFRIHKHDRLYSIRDDLSDPKRRSVEWPKDQVVVYTFKKALTGMTRVKLIPPDSPAELGDAVLGQPLVDGMGEHTVGTISARSPVGEKGARSYTVSTSTRPGCSGAPFFVVSDSQTYLMGLHYGDGGSGNVVIGLVPADFQ